MKLTLASSSPYRAKILQQLKLPFDTCAPDIDESAQSGENTHDYVSRLALSKARAVAGRRQDTLVIGSDQACTLNGLIMGKPGTEEAARKQLKMCSGNWLKFHTGLALVNTQTGNEQVVVETFKVKFRQLTDDQIKAYVQLDQPLDCAGSFKAESLGISLFEAMEGSDFTTLLGLPMISLVTLLQSEGLSPLLSPSARAIGEE
jgi:septum formation protein